MPRRKTPLVVGEYYHIYNRGANRAPIFFNDDNYLFFLKRWREKVPDESATVVAYCLMPNHYHMLVRLEADDFGRRMQSLGTSYSKSINERVGRSGTLFQGRFQAIHVDEEAYLLHLTRYIHLNPVEALFVRRPEEW